MRKSLVLFILSVFLISIALVGVSFGGTEMNNMENISSENVISVVGHGSIGVKPDVCYVDLGVQIQKKTAKEANDEAASIMNEVVNAIKELGFKDEDFETVRYSLTPVYSYPQNEPPVLVGYRVRNILRVKVTEKDDEGNLDTSLIGEVIDVSTENGANVISGISFDVLNKGELKLQAISLAMEDARRKAETALSAVNESIKSVIDINVSDISFPSWIVKGDDIRMEMGPPVFTGVQYVNVTVNVKFGF